MSRKRVREDLVYTFDELSESAKDVARDWYRQGISDNFVSFSGDDVVDDAARLALLFGLDIRQRPVRLMNGSTRNEPDVYYSVGDRSAGASYSASYAYAKDGAKKLAAEAPAEHNGKTCDANKRLNDIALALQDVQRRNFYLVQAHVSHNRRSRDFGMDIEVGHADNVPMSEADVEAVKDALNDFAYWLHRQLESEWEYRMSDECIDEDIKANEYEFTETGQRTE